jgi:hypothetical protein
MGVKPYHRRAEYRLVLACRHCGAKADAYQPSPLAQTHNATG